MQSVNIVTEVAILLQNFSIYLDNSNISIVRKAIQVLIEVCAANYNNQKLMVRTQVVDTINTILSKQKKTTGLQVQSGKTWSISLFQLTVLDLQIFHS